MRSWLGRMTFFMLGKMEEAGNVSAQSLEILTRYMIKMKNAKKKLMLIHSLWYTLKGWFETNSLSSKYRPFDVILTRIFNQYMNRKWSKM